MIDHCLLSVAGWIPLGSRTAKDQTTLRVNVKNKIS